MYKSVDDKLMWKTNAHNILEELKEKLDRAASLRQQCAAVRNFTESDKSLHGLWVACAEQQHKTEDERIIKDQKFYLDL